MKTFKHLLIIIIIIFFANSIFAVKWDPLKIEAAANRLGKSVDKLPVKFQDTLGVSIKLLSQEMKNRIKDIDGLIPHLGSEVTTQLDHAADIAEELANQIDGIAEKRISQIDLSLQNRLDQMQQIIQQSLDQVDTMVRGWIQETRGAAIEVVDVAGVRAVRVVSRVSMDAIRYGCIALFLIGLLAVSIKLFGFLKDSISWQDLKKTKIISAITLVLLIIFFSSTLTLSINPGLISFISQNVDAVQDDSPCTLYKTQEKFTNTVKKIGIESLSKRSEKKLKQLQEQCNETKS